MPEIFLPALTAPAIFKFYKMKAGSNEANGSLAWFAVVETLTKILLAQIVMKASAVNILASGIGMFQMDCF